MCILLANTTNSLNLVTTDSSVCPGQGFEACTKLAQKWLVCVPLGIHLEPINKELIQ